MKKSVNLLAEDELKHHVDTEIKLNSSYNNGETPVMSTCKIHLLYHEDDTR